MRSTHSGRASGRAASALARWVALFALLATVSPAWVPPTAAAATGTQFFVATSGNDAGPGTKNQPFATLARAQAAARQATSTATGDVVINVRAGTHRLDQPLELTPADSGFNGNRVIYRAYGYGTTSQERVVISGGRPVSGWTLTKPTKNIWSADVGNLDTRQLYVNGKRAPRASIRNTLTMYETAVGYTLGDFGLSSWTNPEDVEVVWHRTATNWSEPRCGVASIAATTIVMDQPCWNRFLAMEIYGTSPDRRPTSFENDPSFLTKPGTFVLDKSEPGHHILSYIPRAGESMQQAEVIAPVLETLIRGKGTSDNPLHDVSFQGFTFSHATWLDPSSKDGFVHYIGEFYENGDPSVWALSASDQARYVPGNVRFQYANNINLEGNRFERLGAAALEIAGSNNIVRGNVITDTSSGGILIGDAQPETRGLIAANNVITNNWIHHIGVEYAGGSGITAIRTTDIEISHNQINGAPDRGIFTGQLHQQLGNTTDCRSETWPTCTTPASRGADILNNLVFDVMEKMGDGAGIYTGFGQGESYATGTLIKGNVVRDTNSLTETVGDFRGAPVNIGLYTDYASKWVTVDSNVTYNVQHSAGGFSTPGPAQVENIHWRNNFWVDEDPWFPVGPALNTIKEGNTVLPRETAASACIAVAACSDILDSAGLQPEYRSLLGT